MGNQVKVILGVPWFLPESIGGTEVYVAGLAEELQKLGVECVVAVPAKDGIATTSIYRNIRTVRYPGPLQYLSSEGIMASLPADGFRDWLSSEQPDIYHQHDWTLNCGLNHLRAATQLGITTIITLHLAKLVCLKTTMMYEGRSQCDGQIIEERCTSCFLKTRGVPAALAGLLAKIPPTISARLSQSAGIGRAFSGPMAAKNTRLGLQAVGATVDRVVTVSQWLKAALLVNGMPAEKVVLIRSGVNPEVVAAVKTTKRRSDTVLRVGFIGRWNKGKGIHVLIAALEQLPKTIEFTLTALAASGSDRLDIAYRETIERAVSGRRRYQFLTDQPRSAINELFQNIDVLAVPSQMLENAPLVVLEANAWKVPVVGSDLGGMREMIRHEVDGLLVAHADVDAWSDVLRQVAQNPALLERLRANIAPVRTMRDTAYDMVQLYGMLGAKGSKD